MINTKGLIEGEIVVVVFEGYEMSICKFINGIFVDIEEGKYKHSTYGSSVIKYKKLHDVSQEDSE